MTRTNNYLLFMWALLKLFYLLYFWFVAFRTFSLNVNNIFIKIAILLSCTSEPFEIYVGKEFKVVFKAVGERVNF